MKVQMQVTIDGKPYYKEKTGDNLWHILIRLLFDIYARAKDDTHI